MSKQFGIYIKSHTEAPDYESEISAETLEDAIDYFTAELSRGSGDDWDKETVAKYVQEI